MHPLISIVPTPNGHFIAQQLEQTYNGTAVIFLVLAIGAVIVAIRTRFWPIWLAPCFLLAMAYFFYSLTSGFIYRMEIAPHDSLHYQQTQKDQIIQDAELPLAKIASADMEYQRQDSRIVAVTRDGTKLYPMGEDWVTNEPQQFEVLNAIRQAIGQIPAPAPPQ